MCSFLYKLDDAVDWRRFGVGQLVEDVPPVTTSVFPRSWTVKGDSGLGLSSGALTGTYFSPSSNVLFEVRTDALVVVQVEYRLWVASELSAAIANQSAALHSSWSTLPPEQRFLSLSDLPDEHYVLEVGAHVCLRPLPCSSLCQPCRPPRRPGPLGGAPLPSATQKPLWSLWWIPWLRGTHR